LLTLEQFCKIAPKLLELHQQEQFIIESIAAQYDEKMVGDEAKKAAEREGWKNEDDYYDWLYANDPTHEIDAAVDVLREQMFGRREENAQPKNLQDD